MKWSTLTGLLVGALGVGTLCWSGAHSFGTGLRYIKNPLDHLPSWNFIALDLFAVLVIALSYFIYRARNWARVTLIGGCIGYCALAVIGGVLLAVSDPALLDIVFITGILTWSIAGPLFLVFLCRRRIKSGRIVGSKVE